MLKDLNWSTPICPFPTPEGDAKASMWGLMAELFPIYRALCGPGFNESLEKIHESLGIEITEFDTGTKVFDWTIPPEFEVIEAWVDGPDGKRYIDFASHPYHLGIYSRPFQGTMSREQLMEHVHTDPRLPDALPLRQTYYLEDWCFSATEADVEAMPRGDYRVNIQTRLFDGKLRMGEYFIQGESDQEVLISSYLCHPRGANDNLSGVVVATELFRLLSQLPKPHFSYRLALWPETIGAITYMAKYPERLEKMIGGYQIAICGDDSPIGLDQTYFGNSVFDRAAVHAMTLCGIETIVRPFNIFTGDPNHFNGVGHRSAMANLTRGGSRPGGYPEYHSSSDEPGTVVTAERLLETLQFAWTTLMVVERARAYRATYSTTPFLSSYGIYPHHHGAGNGGYGNMQSDAYYALMHGADGERDLLEIAQSAGFTIFAFDECVADFKRVGLLEEAEIRKRP